MCFSDARAGALVGIFPCAGVADVIVVQSGN